MAKTGPTALQARDVPKRPKVRSFLGWAAIRESRVSSDCLVGPRNEEICPCVDHIRGARAGRLGPKPWRRRRLGRRIGRGGVRSGGRGRRRGSRIYRWTVHCPFLGIQKVRFEASCPGKIPGRTRAKSREPKYDRDGSKLGANRNRKGFSATQACAIHTQAARTAAGSGPRIGAPLRFGPSCLSENPGT